MATFLSALIDASPQAFRLVNQTTGQLIADRLLPAFDSKTRNAGLLRHQSLPPGTAMIIAPSNAIHTFFMKFPIDVVFVARNGDVVKTRSALMPWRIAAAWRAHAVIELAAGALAHSPVRSGDRLHIVKAA